jgi:hypothetical protein
MSKFAMGEQVENAPGAHGLGTVAAGFPAVDFGYADIEGYGAFRFFTAKKPAFGLAGRGGA